MSHFNSFESSQSPYHVRKFSDSDFHACPTIDWLTSVVMFRRLRNTLLRVRGRTANYCTRRIKNENGNVDLYQNFFVEAFLLIKPHKTNMKIAQMAARKRPCLMCYGLSVALCNPINRVQTPTRIVSPVLPIIRSSASQKCLRKVIGSKSRLTTGLSLTGRRRRRRSRVSSKNATHLTAISVGVSDELREPLHYNKL